MGNSNAGVGGYGTVPTTGNNDAFVAALNTSDGTAVSGFGTGGFQRIGGANNDEGHAIAITPDDSTLYVAGIFSSTNLGIGGTGTLATTGSANNTFVAALVASTGAAQTAFNGTGLAKLSSTADVISNQLVASSTNVYIVGQYSAALQYNGTGTSVSATPNGIGGDVFVLALTSAGATVGGFGVSGSGIGTFGGSSDENAIDVALSGGSLYVVGYMSSPHSNFNNVTTGVGVASKSNFDAFVYKIDSSSGAPVPAFGSSLGYNGVVRFAGASTEEGTSVAVVGSNVYFSGYFSSMDAGLNLTNGSFDYRDTANIGLSGFEFTLDSTTGLPNVPVIGGPDSGIGLVGQNFNYQIVASGSPTSYSATGLFDTLTLNTATGVISGVTTGPNQNTSVVITATNAMGSSSKTITLTVVADAQAVTPPIVVQAGNNIHHMTVDGSGNRYICGSFTTPTDFNPYPGAADIKTPAFVTRSNAFVTRFNANGSYAWTQTFGGEGNDSASGVAVSPDGNTVYVVGYFSSVNGGFGGQVGQIATTGGADAFVMALSASTGAPVSGFGRGGVQLVGGTNDEQGAAVVVSPNNANIYISFYSNSTDVGFYSKGTFATTGDYDVMIAAMDAGTGAAIGAFGNGGLQKIGGTAFDLIDNSQNGLQGDGLAITPDGATLYVCGQFQSNNFGIGGTGTVASSGSDDAFIAALNTSNGTAKTSFNGNGIVSFGGTNSDILHGVTATNTNVYATGYFRSSNVKLNGTATGISSTNAGQNGCDMFVLALNVNGTPVNTFGISNSGIGTFAGDFDDFGIGIAYSSGSLFVTGYGFAGNFQFNQSGPAYGTLGGNDAYVAKLDASDRPACNSVRQRLWNQWFCALRRHEQRRRASNRDLRIERLFLRFLQQHGRGRRQVRRIEFDRRRGNVQWIRSRRGQHLRYRAGCQCADDHERI